MDCSFLLASFVMPTAKTRFASFCHAILRLLVQTMQSSAFLCLLLILFLSVLQKVNESYPLPLPGARKMRLLAFSLLWPSAIYNLTLHLVLNGESDGAWTSMDKEHQNMGFNWCICRLELMECDPRRAKRQ